MADFCQQCSIEHFNKDFEDMAMLCTEEEIVQVLCEGCGPTWVVRSGQCIGPCLAHNHPLKLEDKRQRKFSKMKQFIYWLEMHV